MHNMLLFIIFHVVGDFYLQSDEVAKNKENLNTFMLIHSIIYSIPFVLLFIYFIPGPPSWRYRRGPNQAGAALCQTYFCGISSPSQEKSPGHQTHG